MPLSPKVATTLYFTTAAVALLIAIVCTAASLAMGAGGRYLLPSLLAAILIGSGMLSKLQHGPLSARLSGPGALLCTLPLSAVLVQLIHFTVKQPQFALGDVIAIVLLLLLLTHPYFLFVDYKDRQSLR